MCVTIRWLKPYRRLFEYRLAFHPHPEPIVLASCVVWPSPLTVGDATDAGAGDVGRVVEAPGGGCELLALGEFLELLRLRDLADWSLSRSFD